MASSGPPFLSLRRYAPFVEPGKPGAVGLCLVVAARNLAEMPKPMEGFVTGNPNKRLFQAVKLVFTPHPVPVLCIELPGPYCPFGGIRKFTARNRHATA